MQIAAQDCQSHVTFEADLRMVAATFQSIAALHRTDRRFDSRVTLLGRQEFLVGIRLLNHGLLRSGLRQAQMIDKLTERGLVVRRMEAAIEGQSFYAVGKLRLQRFGFTNATSL
jgi:hypothetical protein